MILDIAILTTRHAKCGFNSASSLMSLYTVQTVNEIQGGLIVLLILGRKIKSSDRLANNSLFRELLAFLEPR